MPPTGSVVPIKLDGVTAPSRGTLDTLGYTVTFSVASGQGIVHGAAEGQYAVPVAGVSGGLPTYLKGDYGSEPTLTLSQSGNYFSTGGPGTITITFKTPQTSLALLWGSIDTFNSVALDDGFTVTGKQIQEAALGFTTDGYQGVGGSAYVLINATHSFTTATFTSGTPSFEFAGVAGGSTIPLNPTPEPSEMVLMGTIGIAIGFVALRLRRITKAAAQGHS